MVLYRYLPCYFNLKFELFQNNFSVRLNFSLRRRRCKNFFPFFKKKRGGYPPLFDYLLELVRLYLEGKAQADLEYSVSVSVGDTAVISESFKSRVRRI